MDRRYIWTSGFLTTVKEEGVRIETLLSMLSETRTQKDRQACPAFGAFLRAKLGSLPTIPIEPGADGHSETF